MSTFSLKDYIDNKSVNENLNVEPIPFAGMVSLQDQEDREQMLRHQLHIVQAECQRLQKLLREAGIQY